MIFKEAISHARAGAWIRRKGDSTRIGDAEAKHFRFESWQHIFTNYPQSLNLFLSLIETDEFSKLNADTRGLLVVTDEMNAATDWEVVPEVDFSKPIRLRGSETPVKFISLATKKRDSQIILEEYPFIIQLADGQKFAAPDGSVYGTGLEIENYELVGPARAVHVDHPLQRLYKAITFDYGVNHGSLSAGFAIWKNNEVKKAGYVRHAWTNFYDFLYEKISSKEFPPMDVHNHNCSYGLYKTMTRAEAIATIIENAHLIGLEPSELLSRVIAVIINQYTDGHSASKAAKIPVKYMEAYAKISKPVERVYVPNGMNDGKASFFDRNRYELFDGVGPSWRDIYDYSCGGCLLFACALNRLTGWPIYIEENRGKMFLNDPIIHAWCLNNDGNAVDVFGVRNGNWAPNAIGLEKPWGEIVHTPWHESNKPIPKYMKDAVNTIMANAKFYGIDRPSE